MHDSKYFKINLEKKKIHNRGGKFKVVIENFKVFIVHFILRCRCIELLNVIRIAKSGNTGNIELNYKEKNSLKRGPEE